MIIHYLLSFKDAIFMGFFSLVPVAEAPLFFTTNLPKIVDKIMEFNMYIPVVEAIQVIVGCIAFTLTWKVVKVVLSLFVDLNA